MTDQEFEAKLDAYCSEHQAEMHLEYFVAVIRNPDGSPNRERTLSLATYHHFTPAERFLMMLKSA